MDLPPELEECFQEARTALKGLEVLNQNGANPLPEAQECLEEALAALKGLEICLELTVQQARNEATEDAHRRVKQVELIAAKNRAEAKEDADRLLKEIEAAASQKCAASERRVAAVEEELKSKRLKIESQRMSIDELEKQEQESAEEAQHLRDDIAELKLSLSEQKAGIAELKLSLSEQKAKSKDLKERLDDERMHVGKLQKDIKALERDLAYAEHCEDKFRDEYETLNEKTKRYRAEAELLTREQLKHSRRGDVSIERPSRSHERCVGGKSLESEVEEFIAYNSVDDEAAAALRDSTPSVQRAVLSNGNITGRNVKCPSTVLECRIKKEEATNADLKGLHADVETFIRCNGVDERSAGLLRDSFARVQRAVLSKGNLTGPDGILSDVKNPSALLRSRIEKEETNRTRLKAGEKSQEIRATVDPYMAPTSQTAREESHDRQRRVQHGDEDRQSRSRSPRRSDDLAPIVRRVPSVCMPFVMGRCDHGRNCRNRHPEDSEADRIRAKLKETPCRYGSECARSDCYYLHPSGQRSSRCK